MDRFLALHYHMRYATLVTKSHVKYTLIIIWLISFLTSWFNFWNTHVHSLITCIISIIYLLICTFSYIRIYRIVRRHQLQLHLQQRALQSSNTGNNFNITRLKKSALNTFIFYIALIICYLPLYILLTVYGMGNGMAICLHCSINEFVH